MNLRDIKIGMKVIHKRDQVYGLIKGFDKEFGKSCIIIDWSDGFLDCRYTKNQFTLIDFSKTQYQWDFDKLIGEE